MSLRSGFGRRGVAGAGETPARFWITTGSTCGSDPTDAGSFRERSVVSSVKVEFHFGELFPRVGFIVTNLETDSRAVLRFYNKRGTAEQWIKEGKQAVKMTRLSCHRFRSNEVRLWLSVIAYNLGNLGGGWRCREDRQLVADQLAATVGEDRRQIGQARPVLLAAAGGEPSDEAAVRQHGAADRRAGAGEQGSGRAIDSSEIRQTQGRRGVCETPLKRLDFPVLGFLGRETSSPWGTEDGSRR